MFSHVIATGPFDGFPLLFKIQILCGIVDEYTRHKSVMLVACYVMEIGLGSLGFGVFGRQSNGEVAMSRSVNVATVAGDT